MIDYEHYFRSSLFIIIYSVLYTKLRLNRCSLFVLFSYVDIFFQLSSKYTVSKTVTMQILH